MKSWRKLLVAPSTTILETMRIIDENSSQFAMVVDSRSKLLGTVTDGDIRRGILKGITLESAVSHIMNQQPVTIQSGMPKSAVKRIFTENRLRHLPVLNAEQQIVDFYFSDYFFDAGGRDNWVVLMAGGLGTRLRPLTEHVPKPMLTVGTKPILQTIIESFIDYGFHQFFLSVNYKREMIKSHFGNGLDFGVGIEYLEEDIRLGTAGALSLLQNRPTKPIIVMNGDILTKVNFQQLLSFHEENNSMATMCVREYQYQVPYGVVKMDGVELQAIEEKPTETYFVNAGIYVLNPEALDLIPKERFFDMPSLFEELMQRDYKTTVFPIREYWMDIGRMEEFERANEDFADIFNRMG